ncbi:hypothetical protein IMZ48_10150 [Candidatus Bathyarchaeota archaeon]|nr:hypothetical protein [Candidatus Bathyarchaeota archaeon]
MEGRPHHQRARRVSSYYPLPSNHSFVFAQIANGSDRLIDEVLKFFERQFFQQKTTLEPISEKKTN